jgi:hypothetical protein
VGKKEPAPKNSGRRADANASGDEGSEATNDSSGSEGDSESEQDISENVSESGSDGEVSDSGGSPAKEISEIMQRRLGSVSRRGSGSLSGSLVEKRRERRKTLSQSGKSPQSTKRARKSFNAITQSSSDDDFM